jgi:D-inositol-3-phosphate glycosyltransferase
MRRVAMLSVHTSPLAQPGTGDGGGMNVYVRSLGHALTAAGISVDVLTRAEHREQPDVVVIEPGFRVLHVQAGPRAPVDRHELPDFVAEFTSSARDLIEGADRPYDLLHANYWVSGAVGHRLKHELDLPLITTFHTLDRVKAEVGLGDEVDLRPRVEAEIVRCADLVVASTDEEREQLLRLYGAAEDRIDIIPPGVDHSVFSPGDRSKARRAVRFDREPTLLFVGRIQPLKGCGLVVEALHHLDDLRARLVVIGGPSGPDGDREHRRLVERVDELGLSSRVRFVAPQPHHRLVDFYRAADVCVVPSRTESFGLVALEAMACGTPVVASDVGGLRSLVDHGRTGLLVASRDASTFADAIRDVLATDRDAMGTAAAHAARSYRWNIAAARLRRHYDDVTVREQVRCS